MANYNAIPPKPWKEGQSGNPKGRPVNSITALLKELGQGTVLQFKMTVKKPDGTFIESELDLNTKEDASGSKKTINQVIATQLIGMAAQGDLAAIKELLNRADGVADKKEPGGDDDDKNTDKIIEW